MWVSRLLFRRQMQKKIYKKVKGRQFAVNVCHKIDHPYAITRDSKVYSVNNAKAKTLHLIRGHTYMFNIVSDTGYEFYFTDSPVGGEKYASLPGCKSTSSGPLLLEVTDHLPEYFYYQDRNHKYMGGLVLVHSIDEYKQFQQKKM